MTRSTVRQRRSRGFTLVELMIALLLGAIVITPLYIITRGMAEETTKQQMETEASQRARIGLALLAADLQRAGMMVSPYPQADPDSLVQSGQHAFNRPAIVHLNRDGSDGSDAILLSGNFVSARTYTAYVDDGLLTIAEPFAHYDDCLEEFNPAYSYVHLTNHTGQTLDAKIDDSAGVSCPDTGTGTQCTCTVAVDSTDLILDGPGGFAVGQQVHVEANQTAYYRVETFAENDGNPCLKAHRSLVRYFVDFDGISSLGSNCSATTFDDLIDDTARGTAKVIAEYVQDFEVWFRTAVAGSSVAVVPNYHGISELAGADVGFTPCDGTPTYEADPGCSGTDTNNLSCAPTGAEYGPQFVRSAVVRLGVRTEQTDMSVQFDNFSPDAGVVGFNVAPPPDPAVYCPDVGAYKVRTMVTEVALPNIAARMASFQELPAG